MNYADIFELAGRGPTEMSVASLVFFGVMFPIGVLIGANIAHSADRLYEFLLVVLPGPVDRVSPRSLRFPGWAMALLSSIGLVVEIRTGLQ
ncbi:hypothetical protein [Streptomyces sp. PTY087I2]|uniref:hypothetical protein n=1 Tax=Streptomyces sp. PTY087I2 TaxID=1819298 RepID=UPI00080BEDD8|nr:hypothetical protein [Streptomyces sp. PTY087I2]OCC07316.1 hypothetical protein A3Q37_06913 [Streptomyces sp. PTY087I2]